MCDYSLMEYPNRLALEGEPLVVHRFQSGSLGLATAHESPAVDLSSARANTLWATLKEFFSPPLPALKPAVCIPHGAGLILHDIPAKVQKELAIAETEEVTFVQLTAMANFYRDAVRFRSGATIRIQDLLEGQRVTVVDLGYGKAEEIGTWPVGDLLPLR